MLQAQEKNKVREALGLRPLPAKQEKDSIQKNIVLDALFNAPPADVVPSKKVSTAPSPAQKITPPPPVQQIQPPTTKAPGLLTPEKLRQFGESFRLDKPLPKEEQELAERTKEFLAKPLVAITEHFPDPKKLAGKLMPRSLVGGKISIKPLETALEVGLGGVKGAGQVLEGLTSPINIALLTGTMGASGIWRAVVSIGFSAHMTKGLIEQTPEMGRQFVQKLKEKKWGEANQIAVNFLGQAGIAVGAGVHGGKGAAETFVTRKTGKVTGDILPKTPIPEKLPPTVKKAIEGEKKKEGRTFFRGTVPGETKRIEPLFKEAEGKTFVSRQEKSARLYGESIEKIKAKPEAKILYEGTAEFRKFTGRKGDDVFVSRRKNETTIDAINSTIKEAKNAGYDAVSFKRDSDIGTVILNEKAFIREPTPKPTTRIEKPVAVERITEELKPTSIKNVQVDKELEILGMEPATHGERLSFEQARQEAATKIKKDPQTAPNLVKELIDNPRPVSAVEDVVLLHEQNRLRIERVNAEKDFLKAVKGGDKSEISTVEARIERARDDFQVLADVVTKAGTESSLALGHRRMMMKEDYSLAAMERAKTVANDGRPLTKTQEAEVRNLHEKINKIEAQLLEETTRTTGLERQIAATEATGRRLPRGVVYGSKNRIVTIDRANEIRISLKERLTQLNVGVDPGMISDMTQLGVFHIEAGTRNFAVWSKAMTRELGNRVKPHLKEIWKKANLTFSNEKLIKRAMAAAERSIAEYERRIREQDIIPKKKGVSVTSPALEKLRERRDALKKEFKELRDALLPEKFREEITLKAFRTRTKNQIAKIKDKLFREDFSKPEKRITELGERDLALKFQLDKLKRKFNEGLLKDRLAKRSRLRKLASVIPEAINTTRAIITSIDLSAVLRQGAITGFAHPIRATKVIPAMIKSLLSKKRQFEVEEQIRNRDNYPLYQRSKLYLSEHGQKLSQMEEVYMSRWAEHIPLVAASQRAYTTFLNKLRADSFDAMAATLGKNGKVTAEEANVLANFINVATGRGKIGQRENAAVGLNTVFFAPRYVASRFQFLVGQPFFKGTFRTRKMIATEYARFITGLGVVYGLASLATDTDVEWDPRSSDFGKIRFGKTRLDPLAGMAQGTTLVGRLISGETKRLKSGKIVPIRGEGVPFGGSKSTDVMARFLRSKLSPVVGASVNIATGENYLGEPLTPQSLAESTVIPIAVQDILEIMTEEGIYSRTIALSLLAIFGMGLQTHK